MKIDTRHISCEGLEFFEEFEPKKLDLGTGIVEFCSPIQVRARAVFITNALTTAQALFRQPAEHLTGMVSKKVS